MKKYHLTYTIARHPEGITKEEIPEGYGACDCIIIHSIIGAPENGKQLSMATVSQDGQKEQPLSPEQLFAMWVIFAKELVETMPPGNRQQLAEHVFEVVKATKMAAAYDH
jgi:hypothetical protein